MSGLTLAVVVSRLLDAMAAQRGPDGLVDHLSHALQTARLAIEGQADDELVVAAALHDVGRGPTVARRWPGTSHPIAGSRWCQRRLPRRVVWLVGMHHRAARILDAVEPGRAPAPGAALAAEEVDRFLAHRWSADALALRRWDEQAHDPAGQWADRAEVERLISGLWHRRTR